MSNLQIKPDYSTEIENFLANGGEIKKAVNTNIVKFNFPISPEKCRAENREEREKAFQKGSSTYKTVNVCKACNTYERSVKSNACLECDRRRSRVRVGISSKTIEAVAHYLFQKNEVFSFTSDNKKYVLKIEEV